MNPLLQLFLRRANGRLQSLLRNSKFVVIMFCYRHCIISASTVNSYHIHLADLEYRENLQLEPNSITERTGHFQLLNAVHQYWANTNLACFALATSRTNSNLIVGI